MNLSFKKRWLYIFSNKKAQTATGIGMPPTKLVWLMLALFLAAALIYFVLRTQVMIKSYSP